MNMDNTQFPEIEGATTLTPLDMNKIEILKDHTVISFDAEKEVKK